MAITINKFHIILLLIVVTLGYMFYLAMDNTVEGFYSPLGIMTKKRDYIGARYYLGVPGFN